MLSGAAKAQRIEQLSEDQWLDPQPLQSACQSVLGPNADSQIAPEGVGVWVYVRIISLPNEQMAP